jgi:hypothetical protein
MTCGTAAAEGGGAAGAGAGAVVTALLAGACGVAGATVLAAAAGAPAGAVEAAGAGAGGCVAAEGVGTGAAVAAGAALAGAGAGSAGSGAGAGAGAGAAEAVIALIACWHPADRFAMFFWRHWNASFPPLGTPMQFAMKSERQLALMAACWSAVGCCAKAGPAVEVRTRMRTNVARAMTPLRLVASRGYIAEL